LDEWDFESATLMDELRKEHETEWFCAKYQTTRCHFRVYTFNVYQYCDGGRET